MVNILDMAVIVIVNMVHLVVKLMVQDSILLHEVLYLVEVDIVVLEVMEKKSLKVAEHETKNLEI